MSWHVVGPVMKLNLEGTAKMILVVFANEGSDEGENIGVAVETAALKCGFAKRTVQRYIDAFAHDKVLVETADKVGRGRVRLWRLDIGKATQLYGTIPSYRERLAMQKKGDSLSPFSKPGKGDSLSQKGDSLSQKGDSLSPNPIKDPIDNPARARDAARPEGGDAPARKPGSNRPPYNAIWRAQGDRLMATVGAETWAVWCEHLVPLDPERDDELGLAPSGSYHLAAHAAYVADHCNQRLAEDLGRQLGRPVKVAFRYWVAKAQREPIAAAERRAAESAIDWRDSDPSDFWAGKQTALRDGFDEFDWDHILQHLVPQRFELGALVLDAPDRVRGIIEMRKGKPMQKISTICGIAVGLRQLEAAE